MAEGKVERQCANPSCDRRPLPGERLCPPCREDAREGRAVIQSALLERGVAAKEQRRAPPVVERPPSLRGYTVTEADGDSAASTRARPPDVADGSVVRRGRTSRWW